MIRRFRAWRKRRAVKKARRKANGGWFLDAVTQAFDDMHNIY